MRATVTMHAFALSFTRLCGAGLLALSLAGCIADEGPTVSAGKDGTNAPVGAGVNVPAGSSEDFVVNVGRRTFFDEGSAALSDASRETLDKQAEWLLRYGRWKVKIQGFSDDPGSKQANAELSQRRAKAVYEYLASKGVPANRMRVKAYGNAKERLVNDCADISCKAQNRRVHTNLEDVVGA